MKMGIKDHDDCFFCDSKPETIEHLFWYCDRIFPLWNALAHWIRSVTEIEIEFSLESVLLGYTNCMPCKNAINCIILVVKQARSVDYTDQRAPEALFTREVRGHAPPGNFEN